MRQEKLLNIQESISESLGFTVEELQSKSRRHTLVLARQLFCYIARRDYRYTFKEIGDVLGYRDHTTVIHSVKMIENLYKSKYEMLMQYLEWLHHKASSIRSRLIISKPLYSGSSCQPTTFVINKYQ